MFRSLSKEEVKTILKAALQMQTTEYQHPTFNKQVNMLLRMIPSEEYPPVLAVDR